MMRAKLALLCTLALVGADRWADQRSGGHSGSR
jgi:hypothetical protein